MKIYKESTVDGIFDLNSEEYEEMLLAINDCIKFTDGKLDTFLYNPEEEVIEN